MLVINLKRISTLKPTDVCVFTWTRTYSNLLFGLRAVTDRLSVPYEQHSISSKFFFSCYSSHATNQSPHCYRLPIIYSVLFKFRSAKDSVIKYKFYSAHVLQGSNSNNRSIYPPGARCRLCEFCSTAQVPVAGLLPRV